MESMRQMKRRRNAHALFFPFSATILGNICRCHLHGDICFLAYRVPENMILTFIYK